MLRKLICVVGLVVIGVVADTPGALATQGSGITSSTVSLGHFGVIDATANAGGPQQVSITTQGPTDVYVVTNTIVPGGDTGWHTHPGPSLITVQAGTVTAYDGDDPTCSPQVYSAGSGFIDPGDGHVHLLRNEGDVDLVTVAVQVLPAGTERRIDAPDPGVCRF
jgi:quercetin dioxygenase-like cupin family protein